jgi:hypothetical protein
MARTRLSKHTAINPPHVPITLSSSLQNSRPSVKPSLNNSVTARRPTTLPHKEPSLSSSRNHSIIPHVQTLRAVTRRLMIMVMGGYVRNVIEHGQLLSTGTSPHLKCWAELTGRYILQINLMDHAGQMWITAFNEVAEQMMGISANDLHALKDEGNEVEFNKYFQTCVGKTFTFQMMAKQDTYQVCLLFFRRLC